MREKYFSSLLPELSTRAARSTVSRLGFSNSALRNHLTQLFSRSLGEPGSFVGEPVFEATFGWEPSEATLESLANNKLSKELVAALDQPWGNAASAYRFAKTSKPYKHQLEAWEILARPDPQSVIVTSGTGSGKTECFMVPILDHLTRKLDKNASKLVGVNALFLYPLNALIQSQQERLSAWTGPFSGDIRFCLYNGQTPDKQPQHLRDATPHQVIDRETLRASPPPILVTNATMLEYMLVRAQDAPILQKSKGMLKWIVLDEAHSYIGSQAAELSLLLRRVLHGFGVEPSEVRFVATSATIGDPNGEAGQKLREFLAGLAGISLEQVHVVSGTRIVPSLPKGDETFCNASLIELDAIPIKDEAKRFLALSENTTAKRIRSRFIVSDGGKPANTLTAIAQSIWPDQIGLTPERKIQTLQWLDLLTSAKIGSGSSSTAFLPLRLHAFHNVLSGLWACCDSNCSHRHGTLLETEEWPFGKVFTEQRQHCECGAPVYELRSCNECNQTFLWARRSFRQTDATYRLVQIIEEAADEFKLEVEAVEDEIDTGATESDRDTGALLIANRYIDKTSEITVQKETLLLDRHDAKDAISIRARDETDGSLECPECGAEHGHGHQVFRSAMLGAPFLLKQITPTLLEYCPDGDDPLARPMRGRRMITFTDSRQGTARMSAALQQEAERNRVRSLVYQQVHGKLSGGRDSDEILSLRNELNVLLPHKTLPGMSELIAAKEKAISEKLIPSGVSFQKLAEHLSLQEADINRWALRYYAELDPDQFSGNSGAKSLAEMFIAREFSRRPKRTNSLETMGLVAVDYPKLRAITRVPESVKLASKFSLEEWLSFLKISLDFFVRENTILDLKDDYRRWIGNRFTRKQLLPPVSTEKQTSALKRWPQCNTGGIQPRLVRLLSYVLKLDPKTPEGRDVIDGVLRAAWDDLVQQDILRKSGEGRFLSLEDLAFIPIKNAWLCPVTRRVLDVTLRGVTPYLPRNDSNASAIECKSISVPTWPDLMKDFSSEHERVDQAREWLSINAEVIKLRELGIWSDLNDRIVEGVRYFRTAEHSAQQSGAKLSDYESKFKDGLINLLSCSTTMEMGVDIGGITVVAMNNVPPHPANYLQRAGRAGRRGETRSVALTVCKNNPHDQLVFSDPLWPFETPLPAPAIQLESPVIVQRHVNSMLLAKFLKKQVDSDLNKLDMGWWALPNGDSHADAFGAWTSCFDESQEEDLVKGLRMLLKHTCFEGVIAYGKLAAEAANRMKECIDKWLMEVESIDTQLNLFTNAGHEKNPVFRALSIQRERLTGEYLLRELASNGFLPGYGFPTNITSFDLLNRDAVERDKRNKNDSRREDNKMRHRDLPSRDTVTALREYAPGANVVIDGLVYRSSGITLNWHAPASVQGVREIQNIRQAWRCQECGANGTAGAVEELSHCDDCGSVISSTNIFNYLEPAGFAVDFYEPVDNDISTQSFIPVEAPWINATGDWLPLANPALGSYRTSPSGVLFNQSAGISHNGYAICLECGRSEPMPQHEDVEAPMAVRHLPVGFRKPHRRLRGAQGADTAECKGSHNAYSIKPYLRLGQETLTDVLEVQLNGLDGHPLRDQVTAYSLAVAFRSAVCAMLGVEESEIGCDTKPIRLPTKGTGFAIVIYDRNASGYCSSISGRIREGFVNARRLLECHVGQCHSACQHCLLAYDTRFRIADMDRFAALEFLTEQWLLRLQLNEEDTFFGVQASQAEFQTLPEAIYREWGRPDASELRIFMSGEPSTWDLVTSSLRRAVHRYSAKGGGVCVVIPEDCVEHLSSENRFAFGLIAQWPNVQLKSIAANKCTIGQGRVLAEVINAQGAYVWASRDESVGVPDMNWGVANAAVVVKGQVSLPCELGKSLDFPVLTPPDLSNLSSKVELRDELNGSAESFGERTLELIEKELGAELIDGEDDIIGAVYRDRYLNAPLPVALLTSFFDAVKSRYAYRWNVAAVEIITVQVPEDSQQWKSPSMIFHNWPNTESRDKAIIEAFDYCGMTAVVRNMNKQQASHARTLEIRSESGKKFLLWLDQGFSYWQIPRPGTTNLSRTRANFPFDAPTKIQGEELGSPKYSVEGQPFFTHIFVEKS